MKSQARQVNKNIAKEICQKGQVKCCKYWFVSKYCQVKKDKSIMKSNDWAKLLWQLIFDLVYGLKKDN